MLYKISQDYHLSLELITFIRTRLKIGTGAVTSGNVTSSEGDNQLFGLGAVGSWLGHNVLVQKFNCPFEAGELHHGVRDLSAPQWYEGLVEAMNALLGVDLGESTAQGQWECSNIAKKKKKRMQAKIFNQDLNN